MVIRHVARMTEDGFRCECGSNRCLITEDGVWTPSRRVSQVERDEALIAFEDPNRRAWMGAVRRSHRGDGGFVAHHEQDESLFWLLTPRDDA